MRRALLLVALLAGGAPGAAIGEAAAAEPDGAALFSALCSPCHGKDGSGQTPLGRKWGIPDLRAAEWQAGRSDDAIAATIRGGRSGTRMRPFGARLSAAEVQALVRRIRALP